MKIFKLNGRVKFKELPMQRYDYFNYLNSMDAVKFKEPPDMYLSSMDDSACAGVRIYDYLPNNP